MRRPRAADPRPGSREPLADGIVPLKKNGQRDWDSMEHDALVRFAKRYMREGGLCLRVELQRADGGLYAALWKRGLLDRIGARQMVRWWRSLGDNGLLEHAKKVITENGIREKMELYHTDYGLYRALARRGLLGKLGLKNRLRDFASMSDDELVGFAAGFIRDMGIRGSKDLCQADAGLYRVLRKRRLAKKAGIGKKGNDWSSMTEMELVDHAERTMKDLGIQGKKELLLADGRLHSALAKRGLLGKVGFVANRRDWARMTDEELLSHAKRIIEENGMCTKKGFLGVAGGLAAALRKRGLLGKVEFGGKRRDWASMSDEEIILYAKRTIERGGIMNSNQLRWADSGLLIVLYNRGLIGRIGFKSKKRSWKISDDELVEHARSFLEENGIRGKGGLREADYGLYSVLCKRRLIDQVLADIKMERRKQAMRQVVEGLTEFGEAG